MSSICSCSWKYVVYVICGMKKVSRRVYFNWPLTNKSRWCGGIKVGPGAVPTKTSAVLMCHYCLLNITSYVDVTSRSKDLIITSSHNRQWSTADKAIKCHETVQISYTTNFSHFLAAVWSGLSDRYSKSSETRNCTHFSATRGTKFVNMVKMESFLKTYLISVYVPSEVDWVRSIPNLPV